MMHPPPPAEEEEEEEEEMGVWPQLDSNADVDFVLLTQVEIAAQD